MSDFLINELDPCKIFILVDWKIFSVHEALAVLNEAAKPKKRDLIENSLVGKTIDFLLVEQNKHLFLLFLFVIINHYLEHKGCCQYSTDRVIC